MINEEKLQEIVKDINLKANNNSERQVYINIRDYNIPANAENTKYILNQLLENGIISKGSIDGKGLLNCNVSE